MIHHPFGRIRATVMPPDLRGYEVGDFDNDGAVVTGANGYLFRLRYKQHASQ